MYTGLALCTGAFQVYEIFLIFRCFFGKVKGPQYKEVLAYVLLFCLYESENLLINIPLMNTLVGIGGLIVVSVIYEVGWKRRLLAAVFTFIGMGLVESVVAILFGYMRFSYFAETEHYSYLALVCLPLVQYVVVLIIRNLKSIRSGENIPISYWTVTILLPVLSYILHVKICRQKGFAESDMISCTIIIFVINIMVFYLYDKQVSSAQVQKEKEHLLLLNEFQSEQLEVMRQSSDILRKQKHDFLNHMSSLSFYGKKQEWELLENYIENIVGELESNHTVINTGCVPLDGILSYKLQKAEKLGIRLNTDIQVPAHLELEPYDVTTLFGNLLDNCIEATQNLENKWIYVRVFYKQTRLNIVTRNPYEHELRKQDGSYLTNKENREHHGYGLQNVKSIVDRYDGVCHINTDDGVFEVKITLFL